MSIRVRFFASLREQLGRGEAHVSDRDAASVADVWAVVCDGAPMPANLLMAVNMEYVSASHPVADGDEVAFFPPVTGG